MSPTASISPPASPSKHRHPSPKKSISFAVTDKVVTPGRSKVPVPVYKDGALKKGYGHGLLLAPTHRVSYLHMLSRNTWSRYWFVLKDKILSYYDSTQVRNAPMKELTAFLEL